MNHPFPQDISPQTTDSARTMAPENSFIALLKNHIESEQCTLPVFDAVSMRIQLELVKKDPNLRTIEQLIIADQSLSTNILKVANSVQYSGLVATTSVKSAIVRLGMSEIARIVSIDLNKKLFRSRDLQVNAVMKKLWQHSLACAFAAGLLSERLDFGVMQNEAFFAGLFHDVGKLLILKVIAEKKQKNKSMTVPDELLLEALDRLHAQQGALLLQKIRMPEALAVIARDHHRPDFGRENYLLVLVRMANHICHQMGIGLTQEPTLSLLETEEAAQLALEEADLERIRHFLKSTPGLFE
jgi:putative nucleotidyltransferase with HDIG domain